MCPDPCSCSCVPGSHSSKPMQADGGTHPLSRFFPSSLWESAEPSPQILALLGGQLPGTHLLTAAVTSMVGNAGPGQAPAVSVQESEAPLIRGSGCQCVMALLRVPRLCPLALVLRACGTSNTLQVLGEVRRAPILGAAAVEASPLGFQPPSVVPTGASPGVLS